VTGDLHGERGETWKSDRQPTLGGRLLELNLRRGKLDAFVRPLLSLGHG
jgi:hypothetical protein